MKELIDKFIDVRKLIIRLWLCLWIALIILLIMKFCFGIWYPIVVENKYILAICDYIDETSWLKYITLSIFYILSGNILYLTGRMKDKFSNKIECILIEISIILTFIVKCFNEYLGYACEICR